MEGSGERGVVEGGWVGRGGEEWRRGRGRGGMVWGWVWGWMCGGGVGVVGGRVLGGGGEE